MSVPLTVVSWLLTVAIAVAVGDLVCDSAWVTVAIWGAWFVGRTLERVAAER